MSLLNVFQTNLCLYGIPYITSTKRVNERLLGYARNGVRRHALIEFLRSINQEGVQAYHTACWLVFGSLEALC
jgi:hypothetical protein